MVTKETPNTPYLWMRHEDEERAARGAAKLADKYPNLIFFVDERDDCGAYRYCTTSVA
jgi:hypothetical protein